LNFLQALAARRLHAWSASRSPPVPGLSRADDGRETRENSGYCRLFSAVIQFEFARKHSRIAPRDKVNYTEN
jgi:hypothetical protein